MVKIITDSSSNFSQEEAAKLGIKVMPLTINFGSEEFADGVDIDCDTFYNKMAEAKELPHTSQLTEEQIENAVEEGLKECGEVLIMPIASALSASFERCAAVAARHENVYAYDTRCTTVMLKMLVLEALANADKTAAEIMSILDGFRPKIKLLAALDTLENLRKGGRLSGASAFIGSMLKIKPVITINLEGKVELISKQFGINKGVSYVADTVDTRNIDFSKPVYLIYTHEKKNAQSLKEKLKTEFSAEENICPVIGTHIGPGAAGIVYSVKNY